MQKIIDRLITEMKSMPVIDTHEHLQTEAQTVQQPADLFTRLFHHYSTTSVESAGLAQAKAKLNDTSVPLEERWQLFKPYLPFVHDTGYFRCALIAARELYGIEDLNDNTYHASLLSAPGGGGYLLRVQGIQAPGILRFPGLRRGRFEYQERR